MAPLLFCTARLEPFFLASERAVGRNRSSGYRNVAAQRWRVSRRVRLADVDAVDETGYGLGWDLETVALAGEQTRVVGHDGKVMGGMLASLMTFHERGIVVSVTSNISFADTFALALRFAQAFAEQARSSMER